MKLYEISNELAAILGHEEDELTDEVAQRLTELELAIEAKVENVLQYRQGLLADAEAIKTESDRLKARADALARKSEWLKGYVLSCLQQTGMGKVSTTTFTASVCKSPPKLDIPEGTDVPFEYIKEEIIRKVDKVQMMADYKAGKPLPAGVNVTQGQYLKIS